MRRFTIVALTAVAGICFAATTAKTEAQVSITIGAEPSCPYGYYDYSPYNCAPSGYYGPEWFNGGVFIGAGQWFHGQSGFRGNVDNHYDLKQGYKGPMPKKGEKAAPPSHNAKAPTQFKGNEVHDGHSQISEGKK